MCNDWLIHPKLRVELEPGTMAGMLQYKLEVATSVIKVRARFIDPVLTAEIGRGTLSFGRG